MIATTGIWQVETGRAEEFARRWEESVASLVLDYPEVTFRLLRDPERPDRFLSLDEGWRSVEQAEAALRSPRFQEALAALRELAEAEDLATLELVAEVS